MIPKSWKSMIYGLQKYSDSMCFSSSYFSRAMVSSPQNHYFWGFRRSHRFMKNNDFECVFNMVLFEGPELTFFGFGRVWGPPKSTLATQKPMFCLRVSASGEKSNFFMKKWSSKKTWFFMNFGPPKTTQNHEMLMKKVMSKPCLKKYEKGPVQNKP